MRLDWFGEYLPHDQRRLVVGFPYVVRILVAWWDPSSGKIFYQLELAGWAHGTGELDARLPDLPKGNMISRLVEFRH